MDGIQPSRLPPRPQGTTEPARQERGSGQHGTRHVSSAAPSASVRLHPVILKNELRHRLSARLISRLRDIARQGQLSLRTSGSKNVSDEELCSLAQTISTDFEDGNDTLSEQHTQEKLTQWLQSHDANQPETIIRLLDVLSADEFSAQELNDNSFSSLEALHNQFTPRTLSIFLETDFGKYTLDTLQKGESLSKDEEKKMLLGLTHIQSRLDVRPKSLSDAPLVEYANLFMGRDINLVQPEQITGTVQTTLAKVVEQRTERLKSDQAMAQEVKQFLASKASMDYLPLTKEKCKALLLSDIPDFYQRLMIHPLTSEHLENGELSAANLRDIAQTLDSACPQMEQDLVVLKNQLQRSMERPEQGQEQLIALSQILKQSATKSASIVEKQALALLKDHVDYQLLEATKKSFEQELMKQLRFLEKGGTEKSFTVSVDIGGAVAAASVSGLSLKGTLEYQFKVTGNDDVRIREHQVFKPSLTLTGGDEKVVSVSADLGASHTNGRVFRNLDEFVRFHSNDLMPLLMGSLSKAPTNIRGAIDTSRANNLHQQITADRRLLSDRLTQLGVILPGDQIHVEQTPIINYADFDKHSIRTGVTLSALAGVAEGSLHAEASKMRFKTRTNLLPMLRNNPDKAAPPHKSYISYWSPATIREKELYKKCLEGIATDTTGTTAEILNEFKEEDGLISRRLHGRDAIERLHELEQNLEHLQLAVQQPNLPPQEKQRLKKELLIIRDTLKKAIVDQYLERDMYCYTVNAMEGHVGEQAPQKPFHDAKHSMQEIYKASSRGEYFAAHIYSFYNLHRLYEQTFIPPETAVLQDGVFQQVLEHHIEPSLETPQIHLHAQKHVRSHLTAKSVAVSTENTLESDISLSIPGTNLSASADIKVSDIGQHVNPDNDGVYITVGLNLGAGAEVAVAVKAMELALGKVRLKDTNIPEISFAELAPEILGLSVDSAVRLEFHFVKRKRTWHMQYTRLSGSDSVGLKSPNIGIPTGPVGEVKLGIAANTSSTHNWWESPGNNTLTYIYAKFNGWKVANMVKTPSWAGDLERVPDEQLRKDNPFQFYVLKHQNDMSQMFINMANRKRNAYRELHEMLAQLDHNHPLYSDTFAEQLTGLLERYAAKPTPERFAKLVPMFEQFLTMQHEVYLKEARSRYKPNFRKGRIV